MEIDNLELTDEILLAIKNHEMPDVKVKTPIDDITLSNVAVFIETLPKIDENREELFRRLEQLKSFLDQDNLVGQIPESTLLTLSDIMLQIDFIELQPSDLSTYYETVDSVLAHLDTEKSAVTSKIVSDLKEVSFKASQEFRLYISDSYFNTTDEDAHEHEPEGGGDKDVNSEIANGKNNAEILTTKEQEKKLVRLLELSTKAADWAEKHPVIKSVLYKAAVGTMAIVTKFALKADLIRNKVESEYQDENPLRRSYFEVVKEGIDMYLREPGAKLIFTRDDRFNSIDDWAHSINAQISTENDLLVKLFGGESNSKKFGVILFEAIRRNKISEAVDEVKNKLIGLKEKVADYQTIADRDERFSNGDILVREIWKQFVESDIESPKSASHLIKVCLDYTKGDFSQAMQLTGYVLKFIARSEIDSINSWMIREDLRDEYSEFHSFNRMGTSEENTHTPHNKFKARSSGMFLDKNPKAELIYFDTSYMNRIGLPYHSADMASLLDTFSPECILLMMFGEYLMFGSEHGALKLLSDLRVASELYRIDNYAKKMSGL